MGTTDLVLCIEGETMPKLDGVLIEENSQLRIAQDCLFETPSGAAAVVIGRTSNGWVDWKDKDGRTLHDAKRAGSEES